ncbi:MAG: cytochrome C [Sulfurovum sp.]|nr:MAG: cytochrome C [Sulfurovum sp.]
MNTKENNAVGKVIFSKCIRCHGVNAERKALSKSEIIAGKSVTYLEEALAGYKAGTRNVAGMGIVMNGQIAPLSDDEIKAVAAYISTL